MLGIKPRACVCWVSTHQLNYIIIYDCSSQARTWAVCMPGKCSVTERLKLLLVHYFLFPLFFDTRSCYTDQPDLELVIFPFQPLKATMVPSHKNPPLAGLWPQSLTPRSLYSGPSSLPSEPAPYSKNCSTGKEARIGGVKTLVAPHVRQLPHILQKPQPAWLKQSGEAGIWYMT